MGISWRSAVEEFVTRSGRTLTNRLGLCTVRNPSGNFGPFSVLCSTDNLFRQMTPTKRTRDIRLNSVLAALFLLLLALPVQSQTAGSKLSAPSSRYPVSGDYEYGRPFEWGVVDGAASYRVELCADAQCSIVESRSSLLPGSYWFPREPFLGRRFWRVSAVSPGGVAGQWSRTYPVTAVARVEGKVLHDSAVTAEFSKMTPLPGVRVLIYTDGGDRLPTGVDDSLINETRTDIYGGFSFRLSKPGLTFVAVDSKSIVSDRLQSGRSAWAEQTSASEGGLCGAYISIGRDSACFGGRTPRRSDDASSLATAEHVVAAIAGSGPALEISFGFSFRAVVHGGDLDSRQGSLRQFLENARSIDGPDQMRFVPTEAKVGPRWIVAIGDPLPPIDGQGTIIDGKAHLAVAGAPPLLGDESDSAPLELELPQIRIELPSPDRSDLEITTAETAPLLLDVTAGGTEIRRLILTPPQIGIKASGNATLLLDNLVLGDAEKRGSVGVDLTDSASARFERTHIIGFSTAGVRVLGSPSGNPKIETHSALFLENAVGALVAATGSTINNTFFLRNGLGTEGGAGLRLESFEGVTAQSTSIVNSTFSQNLDGVVIATGSSSNQIEASAFLSNLASGIRYENDSSVAPGRSNKLTRNEFSENEVAAITFPAEYEVSDGVSGCVTSATAVNGGIQPPSISIDSLDYGSARVTGKTCPGATVEFFLTLESDTSRSNRSTAYGSKGEFRYVGVTKADASGNFSGIVIDITPEGSVTAISTDTNGNSSGFADAKRVRSFRDSIPTRDAVRSRKNFRNR